MNKHAKQQGDRVSLLSGVSEYGGVRGDVYGI